ncbi:universal stress protein [Cellulomonas carbonis]|uniref:Universal stress protein UspA n=1 Tax=Cellulomonas carbonis T26 TaxID=947969 RepID=A0A0A0BRL0_9CELL|nr:universal stress protein [Cellulomonas carbonis]KGM10252.1 universal stress protein UspA [Cellulomonas carbonis T26]GGC01974.1 universal stress protein [Cellulomonas carbonis]
MTRPVVVGAEGTDSSRPALVWAAHAARLRNAPLVVVHAVGYPPLAVDFAYDDALEQAAQAVLTDAEKQVLEAVPDLEARTEVDRQSPGRALTSRSADAQLLVVGTHRMTRTERMFSGSLAYQVAAGAECPVAIVPALADDASPRVVVGADGSPDSLAAIRAAAVEADRTGAELHVVHAWAAPVAYLEFGYAIGGPDKAVEDSARVVLAESVAGLAEDFPDLPVHRHLLRADPSTALLDAARDARLVVVGSRGRQGVARMLLGSVSHAIVLHAPCPVLVVRR